MAPPDSHDILPRVLAFYHHWRKLYGPKHLIWFGTKARLTISSPELIREVLLTRAEHFDRYEAHPLICQFEGYGLSNLHGDAWSRHRRVLSPAFHTDNLKRLLPFVADTVGRMLDDLAAAASGNAGGEAEVDVVEWFQRVPQEVITFATFGRRNYDDGSVVFKLQDELAGLAADAHSKVFIPGYRFLPLRRNIRVWHLVREISKGLAAFIANLQQTKSDDHGDDKGGMRDFMSFMAPAMTPEEIIEESKNFFFAGKETLLAMIVNETLRLYPPAVAMIRTAKRDVELGGCVVPAGTELLIPILAVHHDEEHWGADAAEFNPARFGDDRPLRRHQMAFMPFGGGERVCIGQNLALMEAKMALAVVLQRFTFRLSPSYVHAPQVLMILQPQHGAPVIFRPL
ncbi:cytochrome P450 734A5-like [Lolium rigidum]|uniref:cytochrome P450 734A5-like n=1 Tax=Lolium rigidum TaxID=89674 RepID=UPI001F5C7587|nr:cytochrome P450 734A5-like [Lolium rigidum]